MFSIFILIFPFISLLGQTSINGTISNSTKWTLENSPYYLEGTVSIIGENVELLIEEGAQVFLQYSGGNYSHMVINDGYTIIANGVSFIGINKD